MPLTFDAVLSGTTTGPTGIEVPPEIIEQLGSGKKPPVSLVINGYSMRTTISVMTGAYMIPFSSDHRTKSGLKAGDSLTVEIAVDDQPRITEVPEDLATALEEAGKSETFEKLAPSRKKEFVRQVVDAKAAETRLRRIEKVISEL